MGYGIFPEEKKRARDLAKPQDNLILKHHIRADKAALRNWPLGPCAHIFMTQVSQVAKFTSVRWRSTFLPQEGIAVAWRHGNT